jgi:8-oxo-(d)GTP phosphatase
MLNESAASDVRAAGAVVTRAGGQILLVHRPKYDDWSFPKGKLDDGEHPTAAGLREVKEETGLDIQLGPPLQAQRYAAGNRMKTVQYWMGRVIGDDNVSHYLVNDEIDQVAWVSFDDAMNMVTYPYDRATLRESLLVRKNTQAFVVLRHAQAQTRREWRQDDRFRPLRADGAEQAQRVASVLAAYGVRRLASSPSIRCQQTLAPYAESLRRQVHSYLGLSEEGTTASSVQEIVADLRSRHSNVVLCTHRPVLSAVFDSLGLAAIRLEPGAMLVAHLRKGKVIATERHSC